MRIIETELPGVAVIDFGLLRDNRGPKRTVYSAAQLSEAGMGFPVATEYAYYPEKAGTLYGIHFQNNPKPQAKQICCTRGRLVDYVVDLRRASPDYCRWTAVELAADEGRWLHIPAGFGHAILTLEDDTALRMRVDVDFDPDCRRGVAWNDPQIGIRYAVARPILAPHDAAAPLLADCDINL